jgi:hypothetical protein
VHKSRKFVTAIDNLGYMTTFSSLLISIGDNTLKNHNVLQYCIDILLKIILGKTGKKRNCPNLTDSNYTNITRRLK